MAHLCPARTTCTPRPHATPLGRSQDYEQRPPRTLPALTEPLLAGVTTCLLLIMPRLLPTLAWTAQGSAALWVLLALWAATAGGSSLAGPLLGIFGTRGSHGHAAGGAWCLLCCVLDGAFVAGTMGVGAAVNVVFRLVCGQTVAERLLRLVPAVEDATPARVSGHSPRRLSGAGLRGQRAQAPTPRQLW